MYNDQQIADWFIARNRAELRLNDSTQPITKMKLNKLMYLAQGLYLGLYDEYLFHEKSQSKNMSEFDDCISDERAIQLANNYDQILSDKKASAVLNTAWQESN